MGGIGRTTTKEKHTHRHARTCMKKKKNSNNLVNSRSQAHICNVLVQGKLCSLTRACPISSAKAPWHYEVTACYPQKEVILHVIQISIHFLFRVLLQNERFFFCSFAFDIRKSCHHCGSPEKRRMSFSRIHVNRNTLQMLRKSKKKAKSKNRSYNGSLWWPTVTLVAGTCSGNHCVE